MDFPLNRSVLAKLVLDSIKREFPKTRADLNLEFKSTNNQKRNDALSDVIRSLIAYNHIDRHLDSGSNALYLWPKGAKVQYEPMDRTINQNGLEDYLSTVLSRARRQGAPEPVEERIPTPAIIPVGAGDTPDADDADEEEIEDEPQSEAQSGYSFKTLAAHSPSVHRGKVLLKDANGDPADLYRQAKVLPLDKFIEHLAAMQDSFTREDLDDYVGPNVRKNVVSTRLAIVARKGIVQPYMFNNEVRYALPSKVPTGAPVPPFCESEKATAKPRKQLNSAVTTTKIDLHAYDPEASFSLKYGFTFFREDGELLNLTVNEQRTLFKFFTLTNPQALLDHLNEQQS